VEIKSLDFEIEQYESGKNSIAFGE